MNQSTTVVLGGGLGGIAAANALRALLPETHAVVVVDASEHRCVGAAKTWVAVGERTVDQVMRPRREAFARGVRFVCAPVRHLDVAGRSVTAGSETLRWDHLVIALGADVDLSLVPGLSGAHTFYTMEGAERLRDALEEFRGGDVVLLIPRTPFKCPPAPYEAAMLLHDVFRRRALAGRARIAVWTVEGAPMTTAGPEMGKFITAELEQRGIGFHPQQKVALVEPAEGRVRFEGGAEAKFDLLVAVPPHVAPAVVREAKLVDGSGWIPVDPHTLEPRTVPGDVAGRVFAIGDVAQVPLPGRYKPDVPLSLPKAGVFAVAQGEVVARRIAARALGRASEEAFTGEGFCYLELGGGQAVRSAGSFFALPHPNIQKRAPDAAQLHDKHDWVAGLMRAPLA